MTAIIEVSKPADLSSAQNLFAKTRRGCDTDLIGPVELEVHASGLWDLPTDLPPLPSQKQLERLKGLDCQVYLVGPDLMMDSIQRHFGNQTSEGKPLLYSIDWYAQHQFFLKETTGHVHWRIATKGLLPASRSGNYVQRTVALCDAATQVFGEEMPAAVKVAIEEFRDHETYLIELLGSDWKEAAKQLSGLAVNQLCSENPAQCLYRLALNERVNRERLLPLGSWNWTNALSGLGRLVSLGDFVERGVNVDGDRPGYSSGALGVSFSCSAELFY